MNLEQECNRACSSAHQARRMSVVNSPASLLCSSHLSASVCTRACLPCTSSASFTVSMVVLSLRHLLPSPVAYLAPRPPPFLLGQSRLPRRYIPGSHWLFLVCQNIARGGKSGAGYADLGAGASTEVRTVEKRGRRGGGTHLPSLVCNWAGLIAFLS